MHHPCHPAPVLKVRWSWSNGRLLLSLIERLHEREEPITGSGSTFLDVTTAQQSTGPTVAALSRRSALRVRAGRRGCRHREHSLTSQRVVTFFELVVPGDVLLRM